MITENGMSSIVFDSALRAHKALGPGLLESAYEECLFYELNKVILELKSVEALNDVHLAQVLTYLKLSECKLGMLINFNVSLIKNGIRRVVNNL